MAWVPQKSEGCDHCYMFFLEDADPWRDEAWEIMSQRPDVKFFLLTKRPERVADPLPANWGDGWNRLFSM